MERNDLASRVLAVIKKRQPIRAIDVAKIITIETGKNLTRKDVNSVIYEELRDYLHQDNKYQWSVVQNKDNKMVIQFEIKNNSDLTETPELNSYYQKSNQSKPVKKKSSSSFYFFVFILFVFVSALSENLTAGFGVSFVFVIFRWLYLASKNEADSLNDNTKRPRVKFNMDIKEKINFYENITDVLIQKNSIPAYLLYVGESPKELPHLVIPSQSVGNATRVSGLNYWPSYRSISANDRANYISWLQNGRKTPGIDIGYVFLYYYGLEYRAIAEKENHLAIFQELVRLYSIYSIQNNSFKNYCSNFICYLILENPSWSREELKQIKSIIDLDLLNNCVYFRPILYRLKDLLSLEEYISYIFFSNDEIKIGKKLLQHSNLIIQDFYSKLVKEDLGKIAISEKKYKYNYSVATALKFSAFNSGIEVSLKENVHDLFTDIWTDSISNFSSYLKMKENNSWLSNLFEKNFLLDSSSSKDKKLFFEFSDSKLCSTKDLLNVLGCQVQDDLSMSEAKTLATGLERFNIFIEPDARLVKKGIKSDEKLILIKNKNVNVSREEWVDVVNIFDLSMAIALKDEYLNERELAHVIKFLKKEFKITQSEENRLVYRAKLLEKSKITVRTLVNRLSKDLSIAQGKEIAKFLFSIASVDGVLDSSEQKILQSIFEILNFPDDTLSQLINEFKTSYDGDLVVLENKKQNTKKGSAIPQGRTNLNNQEIKLNKEKLDRVISGTKEVKRILDSIFVEDQESTKKEIESNSENSIDLNDKEKQLLSKLSENSEWNMDKVSEMCREFGLMFGSFCSKVNEHYEELYDCTVFEQEGDLLYVEVKIVKEVLSA